MSMKLLLIEAPEDEAEYTCLLAAINELGGYVIETKESEPGPDSPVIYFP